MRTRLYSFALVVSAVVPLSLLHASEPCCPHGVKVTIHDIEPRALPERIPVPELRTLEFVNVRLSAERLEALLASTRVRAIRLEGCPVGDDVCAVLARHPCLVEIGLVGTRITDDGLAMLARLDRLRTVDLRGTRVSESAVAAFLEDSEVALVDIRGTGIARVRPLVAERGVRLLLDEPARPNSRVVSNAIDAAEPTLAHE